MLGAAGRARAPADAFLSFAEAPSLEIQQGELDAPLRRALACARGHRRGEGKWRIATHGAGRKACAIA